MVKYLRIPAAMVKWLMLGTVLLLVWGAVWLKSGVHSLNIAKPWILSSVNTPDAPYHVDFDDLTFDWRDVTELGRLRLSHVTIAPREGAVFAQLPYIYATIDPLGFLPHRRILRTVLLRDARLLLTRNEDKAFYVGIEGANAPMALTDLMASFAAGKTAETSKKIALPFKYLVMERATLRLHDAQKGEDIVGENVKLVVAQKRGIYRAKLTMPFTYEGGQGQLNAALAPDPGVNDYQMNLTLTQFPSRFICTFATCPETVQIKGKMNAAVRLGLMADGSLTDSAANVVAAKLLLNAPDWFAEPLTLHDSSIKLHADTGGKNVTISELKLGLEDTSLSATVKASHKDDGWYVNADAAIGAPLDITKLYRYWPLFMAPESRAWITSKLKGGNAATASVKMALTPEDIAAPAVSDKAISADVAARDITVDYLPNFPYIHHLDGDVHITGNTVKVDGRNGTALAGINITQASLWCPDLNDFNIPMEVTLKAELPVADAIEFLKLKHFTFDDGLMLDAAKASGAGAISLALKFDAFSDTPSTDPNAVHFDDVWYDITANMMNFSQTGIAGAYDVRGLNGALTADMKGLSFKGALALGESGVSDVSLSQPTGQPLALEVKTQTPAPNKPANNFSLVYKSGAVPSVSIKGKQLDGTVSYGTSENSLLKDFPALRLDIALEQLFLAKDAPITNVNGILNCTQQRCEALKLRAMAGKGSVTGDILRENGVRKLVVTAGDAGAFLKALDITDRMTKGKLELRGSYDDSKSPAPYNARLMIQDFTLKNSQILGRILSIGSLTGLANALTGSGIAFDKLAANINANRGVITLKDGTAHGNAMGITIGGTVDTTNTKLKLKGVVIPAYALNSILGKIPIVGALAGGANEGLIAFNYSIKGTYENPEVMVNPLSGLTPGFLRGIFGVFDAPAPAAGETEADDGEEPAPEKTPEASPATTPNNP